MTIGGKNTSDKKKKDFEDYSKQNPICVCPGTPPKVGLKVSFWEPVRLVDVTRHPYCLVSLGGISVSSDTIRKKGNVYSKRDGTRSSFYNLHWYIYPPIALMEILSDFVCISKEKVDVGYMSEFDPSWNNEEWSFIQHPEAGLFSFPLVQLACVADCAASSFDIPSNKFFWCGGCLGSLYPFTGFVGTHIGGIQASSLLTARIIGKFHRLRVLKGYAPDDFCTGEYAPNLPKTLYKTQLVYPVSGPSCQALGASDILWGLGKEFPYKGECFGYLVWKKRKCCLGATLRSTGI